MNSSQSTQAQRPLILLLQGPVGPYFRELHQSLADRGFRVLKVNFNGGDQFYARQDGIVNFRGSPVQWTEWLNALVAEDTPAAIVLFGDSRPYHVEAVQIAALQQITVWCLEEGYVRPNYVTCERSGNNARSPLREVGAQNRRHPVAEARPVKNPIGAMARYAILDAIARITFGAPFHGNVRHRHRPILRECARWATSLVRKAVYYHANHSILRSILAQQLRDYYVVALQVHDDLNLVRNGNGWTMERLIDEAARSFAQNAPPGSRLLFKVHPLDRGHLPYRRLIAKAARQHGCAARVKVADDRPIGPMIRHSNGVITVNSTSGLIALEQGKPLLALGNAVYCTAALNTLPPRSSSKLDAFWRDGDVADAMEVKSFFAQMFEESLIGGNFYLPAERLATADAVAHRIHQEFVSACLKKLLSVCRIRSPRMGETWHDSLAG
ncbi:capsular biosynthesis protein [Bradyrhizobium sp.]|uniref:capsular polysaccharide export protein, LipB/KpsS family n=1 Tax=Bradyrhizobium sp. TaxID=376 RepID=UPI0039E691FF